MSAAPAGVKKTTTTSKVSSTLAPVKKTTTVTKVSPIKKASTTTTTVTQKKVVNGDIVTEQTTTTQTVSGDVQLIEDMAKEMNGVHLNGNGLAENGTGEGVQMVLDSAAD